MATILILAAFVGAAENEAFDAFFKDFSAKRDAIATLEARFKQENKTPEETRVTEGSVVYVNPRRIVFRYEKPEVGATYVIDAYRAYEYIPEIEQVEIRDIGDNPQAEIFFLGFEDNADALREAYNLELFDPQGTAESTPGASKGLAIRPKPQEDQPAPFKEVRLYLRDTDYLPVRIHVINDEDSETLIDISDFKINQPLDPSRAQVEVPAGTKIIENDRLVETVELEGRRLPAPAGVKPE
jgi:outer membrane lipoprotein-sorting protein